MSDFILGEELCKKSDEIVWKLIRTALNNREMIGYYKYPLFTKIGERRKEPDILLLDRKIGLIEMEILDVTLDKLKSDNNINLGELIFQVDDYIFALKGRLDANRDVRGKYNSNGFLILPNIDKKELLTIGVFDNQLVERIIFKADLNDRRLLEILTNEKNSVEISYKAYKTILSIIGCEQNFVESIDINIEEGTKLDIWNKVKNRLYDLDIQQERISKSIVPGPQRIRGIAGSGKTLLICQKAAYMHLKHPEWKIAVTFFTQSLYENIKKNIDMYIRTFTNGEMSYDENSNLMVLHAWGSSRIKGIYRYIANINECTFLNAKDVKDHFGRYVPPEVSINFISQNLLKQTNGNLKEVFDAILIDEGQDLVGDDQYKYNDKQSFYYMCYKSIKPVDNSYGKELRRFIWAYDELQSLNNSKIPSSKEIFGDSSLVKGSYKGGIRKSEIMRKCYRTPHQILTAAHAIGMGFFRKDGMLTGYTTQKDWENIGYNVVEGDFKKKGNNIILVRPKENSPNPINDYYNGNCFSFENCETIDKVVNRLVFCIDNDVNKEKLKPRDILIINLSESGKGEYVNKITTNLNKKNINFYIPTCSKANIIREASWQNEKRDKFWEDNAVTISTILRAKGNEAPMVYVVGAEYIAENEQNISYRNKLFTALTRAKCWVKLFGTGKYDLYDEIVQAIKADGRFEFQFKRISKESNDSELEDS